MWFVIGFVTTVLYIAFYFYKKFKTCWKGEDAQCNGELYTYYLIRNETRIKKIKIGIKFDRKFDFSIKLEDWQDLLFKRLGLSVEFQIGKHEFDKKFYLISDNIVLLQAIAQASDLHDAIDNAFISPKYSAQIQKLCCNSEKLWLEYRCNESFSEGDISEMATVVVPILTSIADNLSRQVIKEKSGFDRYALRAAILRGASMGLMANGLFHLARMHALGFPLTLDIYELMFKGVFVATIIIGVLLFSTVYFLGRTSRAHLVFIEVLLIGGLGAFLTSTEELRDFNVEMDRRAAQQIVLPIKEKTIEYSRGRRFRKPSETYYVHINDWLSPGNEKKINVSKDFYNHVREGENIVVFQKPGRLGIRWVEKITKTEKSE